MGACAIVGSRAKSPLVEIGRYPTPRPTRQLLQVYPAPADVHSAVHSEPDAGGLFPWLPGQEEFVRLGTVTVGNTGARFEFAVDSHVTKELRDMCSQNRPFIYIWLLHRPGKDEVLKIGLGGGGARDDCSAWKTLKGSCRLDT